MSFHAFTRSVAAAALAAVVAGCGGGGSDAALPSPATLQVGGTAATGAALAGATVDVKCSGGDASSTTSSSGAYTVTMEGAALPCIVRVTGSADGAVVTLHSVVESGSTSAGNTTAVANVTPVTELIVAQLVAGLPADAFASFDPQQVTPAALATATAAIVNALGGVGIDLAGIDPLKGELVAAVNGAGGNPYDVLLDKLGESVPPEALPLLVAQVATASSSGSTDSLTTAMSVVSGGTLEGCPVALSGKYRSIEYTGGTAVHMVDFKAMTLTTDGSSPETIVAGPEPCSFDVGTTRIVIGASGAGAFQDDVMGGYFFPVQPHTLASIVGNWNFLESGLNESNAGEHFFGRIGVNADGSVTFCEYNAMSGPTNFGACVSDEEAMSLQATADGSFALGGADGGASIFGYRSPDGSLNLFGTSNPSGDMGTTTYRMHFVMTRPGPLALPALNSVVRYWDMTTSFAGGNLTGSPVSADSTTVTAVNASAGTYSRVRTSDSRVDTFQVNHPVEGLRYRAPATGIPSLYQMPMPGLGIAAMFDNTAGHFYAIAVVRP